MEDHYIKGLLLFTDGSKINEKVGAAISLWKNGTEVTFKKFKLERYCTVFQAELYALEQAVAMVVKREEKEACILSDSRSSLDLLRNQNSFHPLVNGIRKNLNIIRDQGKFIRFYWIKAHIGVEGNERADYLAKQAALYKRSAVDYDACPLSYIRRSIRIDSVEQWQERYISSITASTTKLFFPDVRQAYQIVRKTKIDPTMVQVLTGHGGFSHYLHRFKIKDSPACKCSPEMVENVTHLLTDCPRFGKRRSDLEIELGINVKTESLNNLISNTETRSKFIKFCTRIAKIIIQENRT